MATPLFALVRAREECLHLDFEPAQEGDVTTPSRARPSPGFDQSRTIAPALLRPWSRTESRYHTRPYAGPRAPPGFDQSRSALPSAPVTLAPIRVHPKHKYKYVPLTLGTLAS